MLRCIILGFKRTKKCHSDVDTQRSMGNTLLMQHVRCKGNMSTKRQHLLFLTGNQSADLSYKKLLWWKTSWSLPVVTVSPSGAGNICIIWSWFMFHMFYLMGNTSQMSDIYAKSVHWNSSGLHVLLLDLKIRLTSPVSHFCQVFNIFGLESSSKPTVIAL